MRTSNKLLLSTMVSAALLVSATSGFAAGCVNSSDKAASYGKVKIACLNVSGKATLDGTIVEGPTKVSGGLDAEHATLNQISVSGKAKLTDSTVSGPSKISGGFYAKNAKLAKLVVSGDVDLENTTVNGPAQISGKLSAEQSKFKGDLIIAADKIKLEETQAQNITVAANEKNKEQNIYLDDSVVNGNIDFKGGNGVVHLKGKSSVSGKVIGGKTV